MRRSGRSRSVGACSLIVLLAAAVVGPASAAADSPQPLAASGPAPTVDLSAALDQRGAFRGAPGLAGTIDPGAWTLTTDPATGSAPHFAPTARPLATAPSSGPFKALGSNGHGNGALTDEVAALAVHGSDLYVGGSFKNAAGIKTADYIARWDGSHWHALGSNGHGNGAITDEVEAIAVSGSDVYVGGRFRNAAGIAKADKIARWDGSHWHALGSNGHGNGAIDGNINIRVAALAVQASNLYVGGYFANAAGIPQADDIARWNGSQWHALGSDGAGGGPIHGSDSPVAALAIYLGDLYVGGNFHDAGGYPEADYIAHWDGASWSGVGLTAPGVGSIHDYVDALAVSGSNLYAGGDFLNAAGNPAADFVARWNGSGWNSLGSNGGGDGAISGGQVQALAVVGSSLYVGGYFDNVAFIDEADAVARFDGSHWHALGSNGAGNGAINDLVFAFARMASNLFIGGQIFDAANIKTADHVVRYTRSLDYLYQPDGRVRAGSGSYVGNDVYDTGFAQRASGTSHGGSVTFGISVQNDGNGPDRFTVESSGSSSNRFTVRFYRGTTNITTAVSAGTYRTSTLAPGASFLITAKVTPKSSALTGDTTDALLTISSVGNSARRDTLDMRAKRGS